MKKYNQRNKGKGYSNYWNTPKYLYDYFIERLGYIDLVPENSYIDFVNHTFELEEHGCYFVNPPYSEMEAFVDSLIRSIQKIKRCTVVLLIPSRTDTRYFHKLLEYTTEIEFIKGRLKFNDVGTAAPFPSMLITIDSYEQRRKQTWYNRTTYDLSAKLYKENKGDIK